MTISKYEAWLQTAKQNESITYHEGYLARDRFHSNTTRDIASLFMRCAENKKVVLFQKRLKHGKANNDHVIQYVAKKI